jgi:hypothetical protein
VYAGVKLLENDAKIARESLYNSWTLGCGDFDVFRKAENILSFFIYTVQPLAIRHKIFFISNHLKLKENDRCARFKKDLFCPSKCVRTWAVYF